MNTFQAMELFADQLRRNVKNGKTYKTKVIVTPSSVGERGLVLKVTLAKTLPEKDYQAKANMRGLKLRLQVAGRIESHTGLKQACEMIENLDSYLLKENLRLEKKTENGDILRIKNTRITQILSEDDSFVDSPDSIEVQDVEDNRIVVIEFPMEDENET